MINKYDHLTDQERDSWETMFTEISSLQFNVQQALDMFKKDVHAMFDEVRECKEP
jgi:hypothetical protein